MRAGICRSTSFISITRPAVRRAPVKLPPTLDDEPTLFGDEAWVLKESRRHIHARPLPGFRRFRPDAQNPVGGGRRGEGLLVSGAGWAGGRRRRGCTSGGGPGRPAA